jgi:predicted DNA-binding transcriptional regulator AlpA
MEKQEHSEKPELIGFGAAQVFLSKSRQWIYDRIRSDPTFPRPLRLTPGSVTFRRSELVAWVDSLPRAELDGVSAVERRQAA